MSNINQDLQATHRILTIIEQSKSHNDELLDHLPGIFAIIDEDAKILRGNDQLAKLLGVDLEDLIEKDFSSIFRKEVWNIFQSKVKNIHTDNVNEVQFELEIHPRENDEGKSFYWYISNFTASNSNKKKFFSIVGEDISELRKKEKQLMEIFASIPLGIITINQANQINPQYSQFTEYLLASDKLEGKTLEDTIFSYELNHGSKAKVEGIKNLINAIGQEELVYESIKSTFPNQLWYPIEGNYDGGRWLGVTYQPVCYEGTVKRLLVVLEDRTAIVQSEEALKNSKMLEDQSVARIIQLKKADLNMLPLFMKEIKELIVRFDELLDGKNGKELCNVLHGVKGNARVAGFEFLTQYSHELETKLQEVSEETDDFWDDVKVDLVNINTEFKELTQMFRSLFPEESGASVSGGAPAAGPKDKKIEALFEEHRKLMAEGFSSQNSIRAEEVFLALKSLNYSKVHDLTEILESRIEKTAKELGKEVQFTSNWGNVKVEDFVKNSLSECLLHILNNSIDHGIEAPGEREKIGKSRFGSINIQAEERFGLIHVTIVDDGAGFNYSSIVSQAVKKKLISLDAVAETPREEILKLVFTPGFSTLDTVTTVSGRGVGMDVVMERVRELDGDILIDSTEGEGTKFTLSMRTGKKNEISKQCVPVREFLEDFKGCFQDFAKKSKIKLNIEDESNIEKGLIYSDSIKMNLSLLIYFKKLAEEGGSYSIKVNKTSSNLLQFHFQKEKGGTKNKDIDSLPINFCEDFIKQHNGAINTINSSELIIEFGYIVGRSEIPDIFIGVEDGISKKEVEDTVAAINGIRDDLNLPLEIIYEHKDERINLLIGRSSYSGTDGSSLVLDSTKRNLKTDILKKIKNDLSARTK